MQIIHIPHLDSTSSEILRRINELEHFSVISADCQSAGRGQGDHTWHSEEGKNLLFSIFLKYDSGRVFPACDQQRLTMASSLAVLDLLEEYGIRARIRKPNDIYVDGKKICGILIENSLSGKMMNWSIVGMGIDVNQTVFPDDIINPRPTSIAIETGLIQDKEKCLKNFLRHFSCRFDAIWKDTDVLEKAYASNCL